MDRPARSLPVRRIRFRYPAGSLRQRYVDDDLIMSHAVAVLSATFPPGEDFFIRSVRHYSDRITDPVLKEQVRGFIGQEVTHGREHRELNRRLQEMGYPTHRVSRFVKAVLQDATKRMPAKLCLAYTAALEHYTASIAECLLSKPAAQDLLGDTEVRNILLWHALEETEHKAVAFDVFRAVGGSELLRRLAFVIQSFGLIGVVVIATVLSMLGDRATYNPVRLVRSILRLRRSPFLEADVARNLADYLRRGFHPSDHDNEELLRTWTEELFGPDGSLADHLQ